MFTLYLLPDGCKVYNDNKHVLNMECSVEDIYTITADGSGYDFEWRRVGRRLIGEQKVRDIDIEGVSEGDKREKMLLEWKRTRSRNATYHALVKVLREVVNNATADRVEKLEKSKSQGNNDVQYTRVLLLINSLNATLVHICMHTCIYTQPL